MELTDFIALLGGLALFLYGMQMTSSGLEAAAGDRMKTFLERLTANRFMGVLVGAGITAAIQSSSATTVMVVGFVNAGMMSLNQAVWIIMGANIGTCITGILVSLDMGAVAPLLAFAGVGLMMFVKKQQRLQHIGQILAGLGVLFIGMDMMSGAMSPLRDSEVFIEMVSNFSNPLVGILVGAGFTAVIQSSAAAVGIVQTLALAEVIPFNAAAFVLFGTNIGTCITAVLASIGTSRNAKRATLIHLMFNVIGTAIFTLLFVVFPITAVVEGTLILPGGLGKVVSALIPSAPMAQIAMTHTVFNIGTTLILLPLGNYLAGLAVRILPEQVSGPVLEEGAMRLEYLGRVAGGKENGLGVSAIVLDQLRNELNRMLEMARENVAAGFDAVLGRDPERLEPIEEREEYIDFLNREISKYITHLIAIESNEEDSKMVSGYFAISGNIERIGDHADNLAGYTRMLVAKDIQLSAKAQKEVEEMRRVSLAAVDALLEQDAGDVKWLSRVAASEQKIDDLTDQYRRHQLIRMREGICSDEACILYSELLTDFERIGDHVLNIAEELSKAKTSL